MAKLDTLPGLEATILANGIPAPEHEDIDEPEVQHDNPTVREYQVSRTRSYYIEAETGDNYSILLGVEAPIIDASKTRHKMQYTKLKFYIYVDGHLAWVCECQRKWFNDRKGQEVRIKWREEVLGVKEGKGRGCKLRKFKFAKIETNSDDASMNKIKRLAQRFQKVGTIEIRVYSETAGREGGNTEAKFKDFLKDDVAEIPEKALKGDTKSHGTALEEAEKVARGLVSRSKKKDGEDYPLAIFRFMYRSQEALKQLLIIPRTPSPSPSRSSSREPSVEYQGDTKGAPGIQKLINTAVQAALAAHGIGKVTGVPKISTAQLKKIKREHGEGRGLGGRSGGARSRKRQKADKGKKVLIDLVSDDEDEGEEDDEPLFVEQEE